jgi:hypothetical protein
MRLYISSYSSDRTYFKCQYDITLDIAQAFRLILMMLWLTKLYQANKGLVLFYWLNY